MAEEIVAEAPRTRARRRSSGTQAGLYRVLWRWHFYAGLLVSPVLVVVAVTGGLYVFKGELEGLLYPKLMFATPGASRTSYDAQVATARRDAPRGYNAVNLTIPVDPARATSVSFAAPERPFRETFVDPYSGKLLGTQEDDGVFGVILDIHRRLFIGSTGRAIVELTTCWTIILLVTGLYLWWPRGRWKALGTFGFRLRGKPYVVLRDLHAVGGFYVLPIALTIASTGLLYTLVWGTGYRYAAVKTGAFAFLTDPPKAVSPPKAPRLPLDEIVAIGRRRYPGVSLNVNLLARPGRATIVMARGEYGPNIWGALALDPATGAVLAESMPNRIPALAWWSNWNYPLHVGAVLGTPTKVLWLLTCLVLVALPVTGVWMWWDRRPTGRTGFPRRPETAVPGWLLGVILALSVFLPTVGISLIVILLGEWVLGRVWRWRRPDATPGVA